MVPVAAAWSQIYQKLRSGKQPQEPVEQLYCYVSGVSACDREWVSRVLFLKCSRNSHVNTDRIRIQRWLPFLWSSSRESWVAPSWSVVVLFDICVSASLWELSSQCPKKCGTRRPQGLISGHWGRIGGPSNSQLCFLLPSRSFGSDEGVAKVTDTAAATL